MSRLSPQHLQLLKELRQIRRNLATPWQVRRQLQAEEQRKLLTPTDQRAP